jgi:hypothetical protein
MVFAEIKHHETELLGTEYRTGMVGPGFDGVDQLEF